MKFLRILFFFLCLAANGSVCFGQDTLATKYNGIETAEGINKATLYTNAKKWISGKFMSADNLMQFDDVNQNSIIFTGHILMEKHKYVWGWQGWFVNTENNTLTIKMEISFKEGKFKYEVKNLIYTYFRDGAPAIQSHEESPLNQIKGMPKKKIEEVLAEADAKLKALINELILNVKKTDNNDW